MRRALLSVLLVSLAGCASQPESEEPVVPVSIRRNPHVVRPLPGREYEQPNQPEGAGYVFDDVSPEDRMVEDVSEDAWAPEVGTAPEILGRMGSLYADAVRPLTARILEARQRDAEAMPDFDDPRHRLDLRDEQGDPTLTNRKRLRQASVLAEESSRRYVRLERTLKQMLEQAQRLIEVHEHEEQVMREAADPELSAQSLHGPEYLRRILILEKCVKDAWQAAAMRLPQDLNYAIRRLGVALSRFGSTGISVKDANPEANAPVDQGNITSHLSEWPDRFAPPEPDADSDADDATGLE